MLEKKLGTLQGKEGHFEKQNDATYGPDTQLSGLGSFVGLSGRHLRSLKGSWYFGYAGLIFVPLATQLVLYAVLWWVVFG